MNQDDYYNWHKSIGLVLLALVVLRIAWRKLTALPDWAPTLTPAERTISHWNETLLYTCMFLMPVSGYLFVMAGDYGVRLFGRYDLPNPIGKQEWLATHRPASFTSSPRTRSSSSRAGTWAWVSSTIFSTATAFSTACCRSAGADEEDVCRGVTRRLPATGSTRRTGYGRTLPYRVDISRIGRVRQRGEMAIHLLRGQPVRDSQGVALAQRYVEPVVAERRETREAARWRRRAVWS